ncbi:MAG: DNA mismatch repair endonuclease MutL [Holosporaceae bacterium]|jgi:DNA mismatch repair protein MutL|nr:DNA mismatch repair endonuclease MutL [Holosporaceae bacterium]
MIIKLLSQNIINQIAAGEVIERPASVVKELIENAIDAGAREIVVKVIDAGKSFISVSDDGDGMDKESLELCVLSHATSKLSEENLFDIHTFGFRGEALPSIASVSRLLITSAMDSSSEAWSVSLEGVSNFGLSPASRHRGTTVEVRDLFFATPARLKFLKSNTAELDSCCGVFHRFVLAFPNITFRFFDGNREKFFHKENSPTRIGEVLGSHFEKNTFEVKAEKDGLKLHGFICVPTFNKATANCQYFFVNNRFVRDKNFVYAIRSAYAGLIPPRRYAAAILFLNMPHSEVDVNAHPAKVEVRFRESEKIRFFLLSELKKALLSFGSMRSTTETVDTFTSGKNSHHFSESILQNRDPCDPFSDERLPIPNQNYFPKASDTMEGKISLGNAIYQMGNTYIIAENDDNLIIVDQHAAAERITLEKLKNNLSLDSQTLLLPEVCPLTESQMERLEKNRDLLLKLGVYYEKLTDTLISVNALPAIFGDCNTQSFMNDVIDELITFGNAPSLDEKIHRILAAISCHGSLRAGKKLTIQEMNSLLRQMENTINIAQCCHGRPSYVTLSLQNLNIFFERY